MDELYEDAKDVVLSDRKTSISHIQRRLRIGYNRAATLEGSVSTLEGSVSTLEGSVSTLEGSVSTLEGRMDPIVASLIFG